MAVSGNRINIMSVSGIKRKCDEYECGQQKKPQKTQKELTRLA